ncbi:hypothetical protein GCM10011611_29640 [Aliidongia dinghuensis]|uniref:TonB C-terminal domain-containing protein n=2 Tax=Aliidongia dinghuensis TaxID=1867774 RepID=A0A8J2YU96_9PROT|nr:hypothetical protein GCM10011611_29640 [Aliidongia dinghuensis]
MLEKGVEGNVEVLCDISAEGNTEGCIVNMIDGSRLFGDAALEFVRAAKYRPAMRDGTPVPEIAHTFTIRFDLADDLPVQRGNLLRSGWAICATLGSHPNDPVALDNCSKAIDWPDAPTAIKGAAYEVRAQAYVKQKQFEQAIHDYTNAIASGAFTPETFRQRGLSYLALKNYPKARADFDTALQGMPSSFAVLKNRSETDVGLADFVATRQDTTAAIAIVPDDPSLYIRRATAARAAGDMAPALADLNEALRINPTEVPALAERCLLLRQMGRTNEADADCTKVETLDPKHKARAAS